MKTPRKKNFPDEIEVVRKKSAVNSLTVKQEQHSSESTQ